MIKIQKKDFELEEEINLIKSKHTNAGAVSIFIGYVRDINKNKKVTSIELEVYKEMAKKSLTMICNKASLKWDLLDTLVIHRYGKLQLNEKIVLVITLALHRKSSIASCKYIIDYLKKDAPFWKKEFYDNDYKWL